MPLSEFTTYQAGVLQARAYRNLREFMASELKQYGYTMMEWSLVGLVYDYTAEGGARVSQLAKLLDVETSLVTNMLNVLEGKGLIERIVDEKDKRARRVISTHKSEADVKKIEKVLRKDMKTWMGVVSPRQLLGYVKTLQKLAQK
ncbi:MarR family transcriptional regulator [Candidatus Saccharibacteria bacterium]|nr:MarR family transcriptional regulator [Candidatus Saccharibacteria bacterium]